MSKSTDVSHLQKVKIAPVAFDGMIRHALRYPNESVHGILLGRVESGLLTVLGIAPICHGAPTRPLVEMGAGLVQVQTDHIIVGWYTAPSLLQDTRPGPVALRAVANLETPTTEPALIVLQNVALRACLDEKDGSAEEALAAFVKDDTKQWLKRLPVTFDNPKECLLKLKASVDNEAQLTDFLDHLQEDEITAWLPVI